MGMLGGVSRWRALVIAEAAAEERGAATGQADGAGWHGGSSEEAEGGDAWRVSRRGRCLNKTMRGAALTHSGRCWAFALSMAVF